MAREYEKVGVLSIPEHSHRGEPDNKEMHPGSVWFFAPDPWCSCEMHFEQQLEEYLTYQMELFDTDDIKDLSASGNSCSAMVFVS